MVLPAIYSQPVMSAPAALIIAKIIYPETENTSFWKGQYQTGNNSSNIKLLVMVQPMV